MTILSADLRFFAAQFPTDDAYGGGPMSGNIVQDNVSQNIFPLIGEADAAIGRVQMRKVYASVLSANTDRLLNAGVNVWTPPTDADVDVVQFRFGDAKTTRAEAAVELARFPFVAGDAGGSVNFLSGPSTVRRFGGDAASLAVGDKVMFDVAGPVTIPTSVAIVTNIAVASGLYDVTLDFISGGGPAATWVRIATNPSAPRVCGSAAITVPATATDTEITVSRLDGRLVPNVTPYPSAPNGIDSTNLRMTNGTVPIFRPGDLALVRDASGTTTELVQIASIDYLNETLTLTTPLVNSYAGGFVTSLVDLGDMQAEVGSSFSQQTWTRVFSDTIIGNPIGANFNRTGSPIVVTNEGAETERWAFVFTSATDFKLIGESIGQIATGSTGVDFSPINPKTSEPFFTMPSTGWGTGWQAGNVLRLNTTGARVPFWAARCISPGASASTDSAVFQFRGSF